MTSTRVQPSDPSTDDEFRQLVQPYERELHAHCYRMLGSVDDADDLLQEVRVAAWRGLPGFDGRASVRTWLYRIATNRCLNAIRDGARRPPPAPPPPFDLPAASGAAEATWLQPYPDDALGPVSPETSWCRREAMELTLVHALQLIPPRQAAAVLLIDLLGFGTAEAAAILDANPTVVKGLVQRGRRTLAQHRGGPLSRAPGQEEESEQETEQDSARIARAFAAAYARDDIDAMLALMSDDAWLTMPPAGQLYRGRDAVGAFLTASARSRRRPFRLVPAAANRGPVFVCSLPAADDDADGPPRPAGVLAVDCRAGRVVGLTRFLDPGLNERFAPPLGGEDASR